MLKKILIGLLVFCLLVGVLAYFGAQVLVRKGSSEMLSEPARYSEGKGVELVSPEIDAAKVSFLPVGVEWEGFRAKLKTTAYAEVWGVGELDASFERIAVRANDSKYEELVAELSGGEIVPAAAAEVKNGFEFQSFSIEQLALPIRLDPDRPEESVASLLKGLGEFLSKGDSQQAILLKGTLRFIAGGNERELGIESRQQGRSYSFEVDRESLSKIVSTLQGEWTEAEIEVVSRYPIQAPVIMYLSEYSVLKSKEVAAAGGKEFPEDAYRHLLWSFLLTNRVGETLAEKLTDAHEVGSTGNTEADHRMDYHNNAIGRRYAVEGKTEEDLVELVLTDPEVIRKP